MKKKLGFTLIELLIVMAVVVLLIAAAVPVYSNFQVSAQLNESAAQLSNTIRLARVLSVSRTNNSSFGVYIDANPGGADRIILFSGSSYASRNPAYDRVTTLDGALSLAPTLSAGAQEIIFTRTSGVPSATGTVTITHATAGSRTISINPLGVIDYE